MAGLCAGVAILGVAGWLLENHFSRHTITDQQLLREAVDDWAKAGKPGTGPDPQIFEQQAGQGYYDDAAATGRLFDSPDEVQWAVVELAKIRAQNGDVQGAKAAVERFQGSSLGERATRAIANVQAHRGDLDGALTTASGVNGQDEVFAIVAGKQIDAGDFEGALATSERMSLTAANQLFYEVGEGLRLKHQQGRVKALAAGMRNPQYAADFKTNVRFTLWDEIPVRTVRATPCDMAGIYALEGKFALADSMIEENKCSDVQFVAVRQYAVDPVGAERLLRRTTRQDDLTLGLYQFAIAAAENGNVSEGLRFLDELGSLKSNYVGGNAIRAVARAWTIRDGAQTVLPWARSRPTLEQKTSALIGMAEALGHARPTNQ